MDKVRSTLKQLVRDWSEEVGATSLLLDYVSSQCRERKKEMRVISP